MLEARNLVIANTSDSTVQGSAYLNGDLTTDECSIDDKQSMIEYGAYLLWKVCRDKGKCPKLININFLKGVAFILFY